MIKEPMTADGYRRVETELKRLKHEERPAVIKAIEEARAHGDLSENAEYHAAKERQAYVEGRVAELEDKISRAEVIDLSTLTGTTVMFGATVSVADEDTDEESTYQIVGTEESDIKQGRLSIASPLARALIGKSVGDSAEVSTPKGPRSYEIISLRYEQARPPAD
ncbi:MAG: transcription elongation factor GreA [Proteobacteria bacterium]|nr:transcription elongation factor GreA [Pseudomonadota bacterium]MDA1058679.1 transcription elongation factor GreA [Pseudomonadota bacterium]